MRRRRLPPSALNSARIDATSTKLPSAGSSPTIAPSVTSMDRRHERLDGKTLFASAVDFLRLTVPSFLSCCAHHVDAMFRLRFVMPEAAIEPFGKGLPDTYPLAYAKQVLGKDVSVDVGRA